MPGEFVVIFATSSL